MKGKYTSLSGREPTVNCSGHRRLYYVSQNSIYDANYPTNQPTKQPTFLFNSAHFPCNDITYTDRSLFVRFIFARLENLQNFSKLRDNFRFTAMWHTRSVVALVLCWRLAQSDVIVTPSVMIMDWLGWWCNHGAGLVSCSTILTFLSSVDEKSEFTSPSEIQVKKSANDICRSRDRAPLMCSCKYNQQDATLYNILYYCQWSTCFGRFLRPSSGARNYKHSIWYVPGLLAATAKRCCCCCWSKQVWHIPDAVCTVLELLMTGG